MVQALPVWQQQLQRNAQPACTQGQGQAQPNQHMHGDTANSSRNRVAAWTDTHMAQMRTTQSLVLRKRTAWQSIPARTSITAV